MIVLWNKDEQDLIKKIRSIGENADYGDDVAVLSATILALKRQISDLEISKSKITEDNAREKRELTHMIGLEKKRQEMELALATREAKLTVGEANLVADKKRFDEQMAFIKENIAENTAYLKSNFAAVLDRLPTVNVDDIRVTERKGK